GQQGERQTAGVGRVEVGGPVHGLKPRRDPGPGEVRADRLRNLLRAREVRADDRHVPEDQGLAPAVVPGERAEPAREAGLAEEVARGRRTGWIVARTGGGPP